jgi:hypothetical protein
MQSAILIGLSLLIVFSAASADAQSTLDHASASPYAALKREPTPNPDSEEPSGFVGEAWGEVPLNVGSIKNAASVNQRLDEGRAGKTTR